MDLNVIYESIVPDNIKDLPVVKESLKVFIEMLNRNAKISQRINKIFSIDDEVWYKLDSNGEPITISDSKFLKQSKNNLKKGLLLTYLGVLYDCSGSAQLDNLIRQATKLRNYTDSLIYKEQTDTLTSEFLGSFRSVQQSIGTENAFNYMYQFSKYLETGYMVDDLDTKSHMPSIFVSDYKGSLHKYYFTNFLHNLAHPVGWIYTYTTVMQFVLEDIFGIIFLYTLPRIVIKNSNDQYIFFTNLNQEQFLDSLRQAIKSDETRSHTIWMERPLYYDQDDKLSRSITFKQIEQFRFKELNEFDPNNLDEYFKDADVLLVHYTYKRYDSYTMDGSDKSSLITFTNNKIIYFDNNNVYFGDLNNSYDGPPFTEKLYKFEGYFDLDCGSTKEIEDGTDYKFIYRDDVSWWFNFEPTQAKTFYLEPNINNAFKLKGNAYIYTQGYDEANYNLSCPNGNVREFDKNFDISFTFKNKQETYIKVYSDFGQQWIQTFTHFGENTVKLSVSEYGGEYLNVRALTTDSDVYLRTNMLDKHNNRTKITHWDYDDLSFKLTITGTTTLTSLNLICNDKTYSCSIDNNIFNVVLYINDEVNICVDNLHLTTNLFKKNLYNSELQHPNFIQYNAPKQVNRINISNPDQMFDGVNADADGNMITDVNDTLGQWNLTNACELSTIDKVNLDDYTDSNYPNNLCYIYRGYEPIDCNTSEIYVMDSTKYVVDDIFFQYDTDYFLVFNDANEGDSFKDYNDFIKHQYNGNIDYTKKHSFLFTIESQEYPETIDRASWDRINHVLTFKK